MSDSNWKKLLGAAQVVVGGALVLQGLKHATGREATPLFGLGRAQAMLPGPRGGGEIQPGSGGNVVRRAMMAEIDPGDLDARVERIMEVLQRSSLDPQVREDAAWVLNQRCGASWCVAPKSDMAEITALFDAVTDPSSPLAIRYTSDHVYADQFHSYRVLRKLGIGDCDDMASVYLGSLLSAVGFQIQLRVVRTTDSTVPNHIYIRAGVPKGAPERWIPLDPTEPQNKVGWEVNGAEQAALSGRSTGQVAEVWDYDVWGLSGE